MSSSIGHIKKNFSAADLIAERKANPQAAASAPTPIFKRTSVPLSVIPEIQEPEIVHLEIPQANTQEDTTPDIDEAHNPEISNPKEPPSDMGAVIDIESSLVVDDEAVVHQQITLVEEVSPENALPLIIPIEDGLLDIGVIKDKAVPDGHEIPNFPLDLQNEKAEIDDQEIIAQESSALITENYSVVLVPENDGGLPIDPVTGHRILSQVEQLGEFKGVILGLPGDRNKAHCAVLDLGCAEVLIVCVKEFYGTALHSSLLSTLSSSRYDFKLVDEYLSSEDIITKINSIGAKKAQSTRNGEVISQENRFLVVYDDIVRKAIQLTATDVHFEITDTPVSHVRLRIYGRMKDWKSFSTAMLKGALTAAYSKRTKSGTNSAGALSLERAMNTITEQTVNGKIINGRFSGYPLVNGYDVVMRLLDSDPKSNIPSPGALGYSDFHVKEQIMPAIGRNAGLIAIAGSTGSGKSTALRSFIYSIPDRDSLKIYSVEDPVEYVSYFMRQISVQRSSDDAEEVVKMKFLSTLRSILRMDPDALMLGEIRDHDSASIASEFNRTGHRVFTTVHGDGCVDVLARLASDEIGIHPSTLASPRFLSAILYQKLLPKLCPHCKVPAVNVLTPKTQNILREKFLVDPGTMFCASTIGCPHCKVAEIGLAGTKGLTVVAEILTPTEEIREAIGTRSWSIVQDRWRDLRTTAFDDADMAGKTAFEHALYKACVGLVDPQDIESDFESFGTYDARPLKKRNYVHSL